jgi:glycogen(starch) synthase
MRILYWTGLFWPYLGGVEVLSARLLPVLVAGGHEIVVVTAQDDERLPPRDEYAGVAIHRFPFWQALSSRDVVRVSELAGRLADLKRRFAPDLVHILQLGGAGTFFQLQTAPAHRAPVLVALHGEPPPPAWEPDTAPGRVLRAADWVVTVSAVLLRKVRRRLPTLAGRSSIIRNGLPVPPLPPAPPPTAPTLLCVARLHREKGVDVAVEAMVPLRRQVPAAQLVVAGSGPERPALEARARHLGLDEGAVRFVGPVAPDHMPALLRASRVLVVPSRTEGFPLVAMEAALMARPVVATRVGGVPECVLDGRTGLLVPPEDPRALAEALSWLLARPDTARAFGRHARRRARRRFTLARCADQYLTLYARLAGRSHAHTG